MSEEDGRTADRERELADLRERIAVLEAAEAERALVEAALRLNESRLQALLKLNQMDASSVQEITDFALEEAVRLTGSALGYLAFMNEDESVLTMHAWSKTAMEECAVIDRPIVYPMETTGLWGEAVRQRRPVITNDYPAKSPLKKGHPEGHVEILRHMNVPVFEGDRIVAVAGVGNKEAEYDDADVRQLTLLMQGMWRLLQRREEEEKLEDLVRQRMETSEARFRTLYDTSRDAIMVLDPERGFVSGNPAAVKLFGCRDEEHFRTQTPQALSPERQPDGTPSADKAREMIEEVLRTGSQFFEWHHRRADGAEFPATVLLTRTELSGRTLLQATVRDITIRKEFEEKLRMAKDAAESASRAKSDFLANMSHEIRTPMNAIIGMTELLLDTAPTPQQGEYLDIVRKSSESLLRLIDDILDLSRIEAGKLSLDPTSFDLRESLGDTMKLLAVRAHAKGLELLFKVHPDVPARLYGDRGRLRQIVVNLVGNGIKFTEAGEVVLAVDLEEVLPDGVRLHFSVTDTGIGVPKERQAAVFGAFEQADPSSTRRFGGSGLGLSISSRLVDIMDGKIWMESREDGGSIFHFTARFVTASPDPEREECAPPEIVSGLKVLVVDDNETNRLILEESLEAWTMCPTVTGNGSDAIRHLREAFRAGDPFALVIADADMPEIDGFALAKEIRHDPELSSTVLMMLSSGGGIDDVARCEELGVSVHLKKPIQTSELFEAILTAIGVGEAADDVAPTAAVPPSRRSLRILLAEDSVINQKLAVALLTQHGHSIAVAHHGREAVEAYEREPFDVVLMDVQMPEMDGFEATARIRERERETGRHVPIVAITAHALRGDRERCIEAGMDDYVSKPIRAAQLLETIDRAVSPAGRLDRAGALEMLGGNRKLLGIVTRAAVTESPRMLRELREAVERGDAPAVRISAHSFKGSFRYFGDGPVVSDAYRLERMGQEGDLDDAEEVLERLETGMDEILPVLQTWLREEE